MNDGAAELGTDDVAPRQRRPPDAVPPAIRLPVMPLQTCFGAIQRVHALDGELWEQLVRFAASRRKPP